jgi:hypothetical protein
VGGLGLSVVAWVAGRHGGHVQVIDSLRGATFEFSLPGPIRDELIPVSLDTVPAAGGPSCPSAGRA